MLKRRLIFLFHYIKWKKANKHNLTVPGNYYPIQLVQVGNYTYGKIKVIAFSKDYHLKIGHYCSIANDVVFILSGDHDIGHISTYPFKSKMLHSGNEAIGKGDIIIGDDVWIGQGVKILSGVTIGQGAVIAAGSVVTKNVIPYSVVGGIPAKEIKKRFTDELIERLMTIDYSKLTKEIVEQNIDKLYSADFDDLEWLPRR